MIDAPAAQITVAPTKILNFPVPDCFSISIQPVIWRLCLPVQYPKVKIRVLLFVVTGFYISALDPFLRQLWGSA